MPKLGNKKYNYDEKGMKAYIEALKKKRKKTSKSIMDENDGGTISHGVDPTSGQGGMG